MVDLRDLAVAQQRLKVVGAKEADERSAGITVGQGLNNLEIGDRGVEDIHAVAHVSSEVTASAM
ncbi:hypothetical protein I545_5597 [Mycobacterium kansasii 662]|uniref:Uncharacterized protein n=2 Tax=Mycobacterium kansasii TaxID=1768 RepID=A0A1V3XE92_MYCKA|nr:hypothetical protein I547_6481 [Mycobacterium kansasii 824]EUA11028.1 hypothetical protein I545_5597 [Mycobacterium kansasii 662]KEP42244.1 hypothetical protein MKSMC1_26210 [Mycobacterium kansasii]OOK66795.1 hypothetical protein BZL30_8305 [Mycobacterium kansasii]OOK77410.1 hypothetical protein BZL29_3184 [Mycobacterium kansasii]